MKESSKFVPLVNSVSVSRATTKSGYNLDEVITRTTSKNEYGKIISYKNRKEYGDYRRAK